MQSLVRMASALRAAWNVIEVVDALNGKRDMPVPFDKRQVSARIRNLRKQKHLAVIDAGSGSHGYLVAATCVYSCLVAIIAILASNSLGNAEEITFNAHNRSRE